MMTLDGFNTIDSIIACPTQLLLNQSCHIANTVLVPLLDQLRQVYRGASRLRVSFQEE